MKSKPLIWVLHLIIAFATIFKGSSLLANIDLESNISDFVLDVKRINVPEYPLAFNPSIVRWNGRLLMSFRILNPTAGRSQVGFVWLNEDFTIDGQPEVLLNQVENFKIEGAVTTKAEDVRLIEIDSHLYMIYNDYRRNYNSTPYPRISVAHVTYHNGKFFAQFINRFEKFPGQKFNVREKNWSPFAYENDLLFVYSILPHHIFSPLWGRRECETFSFTKHLNEWNWGELRGGTPALKIDEDKYLSFFHSVQFMQTKHSNDEICLHYFMGAYTFSTMPPFEITHISSEPIIGPGFYNGKKYDWYWKPVVAIFPAGYVFDDEYIWVSYGRADHEMWIVKLDKQRFLESLIPTNHDDA
jgi:predicted GH43/DUF377 family glycosyl hydrolase